MRARAMSLSRALVLSAAHHVTVKISILDFTLLSRNLFACKYSSTDL